MLRVLLPLSQNMHMILGKFCRSPTLFRVTIYIYLYIIIHVFYFTVYIYIHMVPVLSYFIQVLPYITYIYIYFQRIVPTTNTHITSVRSITGICVTNT